MQALNTEYNVLFNAIQSYEEGINIINKAHTDDYSKLIPLYPISVHTNASVAEPQMDRAIEKVDKAIKTHSIRKKPKKDPDRMKDPKYKAFLDQEEYNYRIDETWILLGQAQFHKADFLAAVGTFTYIINHFSWNKECVSEARIWLAKSYIEMDWLYDAEDILIKANKDQVPTKLSGLYSAASSDLLLRYKKYEEAIPLLKIAAKQEKKKNQKTRFYYVLAQLYRLLDNEVMAKTYFSKVIKSNPPSEMEFNARISRAEAETEQPEEAIRFLQKMLKNSKYSSHKEMVYFTIGNIYKKQENYEEATNNYKLAIEESDNNIVNKVQILIALADLYYDLSNYLEAQPIYNEASTIMPLDNIEYERVRSRSEMLDKLNQQHQVVVLQDSLQDLSRLSDKDKITAIENLIKNLQKKEKFLKEKLLAETTAQNESFLSGDGGMALPGEQLNFKGNADWYFYNNMLKQSGKTDFQRKWGARKLEDNWRRKNKSVFGNSDDDQKFSSSGNTSPSTTPQEEDNYIGKSLVNTNVDFYLKQIPSSNNEIATSNKLIADALYTVGMMYKEDIGDIKKAKETFDELERRFPKDERLADVYYNLYQMNMKADDTSNAEFYRNQIIKKFPESAYAIMFSRPDYAKRLAELKSTVDSIYQATYFAYLEDDFETVDKNNQLIKEEYPLSDLMPKFIFLNALSKGKSRETDLFIEALESIISEYPQSEVSSMAKDILALTNQGYEAQAGGSHNSILSRRDSMCLCQDQVADTLVFENNPKDKYLLIVEAPKKTSFNQLQYDVAIYNFSGFMIKDFDLAIKRLLTSNLFVISSFDGYQEALWYKNGLYNDTHVRDFILLNDCDFIIISATNFDLIKKGRSLKEYQEFYESNIIKKKQKENLDLKDELIPTPSEEELQSNDSVTIIDIDKLEYVPVKRNKAFEKPITKKDSIKEPVIKEKIVAKKTTPPKTEAKKVAQVKKITEPTIKKEKEIKPKKVVAKKETKTLPEKAEKPIVVKKEIIVSSKPKETKLTPVNYVYKSFSTHYYGILVQNGSFDFNEIKEAFNRHNESNYPIANYKISIKNIGTQKLILIGNFPTTNSAKTYLFRTNRNRELFESLKDTEFRKIIISVNNLEKLIKSENITNYLEFNRNSNMK